MGTSCLPAGVDADAFEASCGASGAQAPARIDSDALTSALRAQHGEARKPCKQVGKRGRYAFIEAPTEDETKSCRVFAPPQAATDSVKKPSPPKQRNCRNPVRRRRPWADSNRTTVLKAPENDFPT